MEALARISRPADIENLFISKVRPGRGRRTTLRTYCNYSVLKGMEGGKGRRLNIAALNNSSTRGWFNLAAGDLRKLVFCWWGIVTLFF